MAGEQPGACWSARVPTEEDWGLEPTALDATQLLEAFQKAAEAREASPQGEEEQEPEPEPEPLALPERREPEHVDEDTLRAARRAAEASPGPGPNAAGSPTAADVAEVDGWLVDGVPDDDMADAPPEESPACSDEELEDAEGEDGRKENAAPLAGGKGARRGRPIRARRPPKAAAASPSAPDETRMGAAGLAEAYDCLPDLGKLTLDDSPLRVG